MTSYRLPNRGRVDHGQPVRFTFDGKAYTGLAGDTHRIRRIVLSVYEEATVYRTLQKLSDSGEVDMLRTEDGEAIYRRCSATHHHHLVCRACGATVEVEGPAVERWTRAIATEHGYDDISHTLEIFGTCASCR